MVEYQRKVIEALMNAAIADVCRPVTLHQTSANIGCPHCGYPAVETSEYTYRCTECYNITHEEV